MIRRGIRFSLAIGGCFCALLLTAPTTAQAFTTIINVPPDPDPRFIGSDTQLNLSDGGFLNHVFVAGRPDGSSSNTELNMTGGFLGGFFRAFSNTTVNISGGTISSGFNAGNPDGTGSNTLVNISGGSFGIDFETHAGSITNISGGTFIEIFALDGSVININDDFSVPRITAAAHTTINVNGGNTSDIFLASALSTVNLAGGTVSGVFKALFASEVNVLGTSFVLDGVDLTPTLTPGVPVTIPDRGVLLDGTFANGNPFSLNLNPIDSVAVSPHFFSPKATLTITLVPEPGALALLGAGGLALIRRRRVVK